MIDTIKPDSPKTTEATGQVDIAKAVKKWGSSPSGREDVLEKLIGREVGEFVIGGRLGGGGFGEVYQATQKGLNREAVIKFPRQLLLHNEDDVARFIREAKLASKVDHPYAAHIYGYGVESDGLSWIAMEYVRGTTLAEMLELRGGMPIEQFIPLFSRLCEVVQQVHEHGIIHCDIKPANIMVLSRAGQRLPKLLDLGIAQALGTYEPLPSAPGMGSGDTSSRGGRSGPLANLSGSPSYMAPEQWARRPVVAQTDVYALGVAAYEALTGRLPFQGADTIAMARAHAKAEVPSLGDRFSPALDAILAKAMAKRPKERYDDPTEFARELRRAAGFADEHQAIPKISLATRERVFSAAPIPLARAIHHIDSATTLFQAQQAVIDATRTAATYVGLLAISGYSAVRQDDATPAGAVGDILRELRDGDISVETWLELTSMLCEPYHDCPDLFPIPELVELAKNIQDEFAPLLAANDSASHTSESEIAASLERQLAEITKLAESLAFLDNYRLTTCGAKMSVWAGLRPQPYLHDVGFLAASSGRDVLLTDGDGVPQLRLSPLMTLSRPTPEADAQLFLFRQGTPTGDARLQSVDGAFTKHDQDIWDYLAQIVPQDDASEEVEEVCPYLGLASFSKAQAGFYFGREAEVDSFLNRLQKQPLVAIAGPSGSGKSSFIRAGVLPVLSHVTVGPAFRGAARGWSTIFTRPGTSPFRSLQASLDAAGIHAPDLEDQVLKNPAILGETLRAAADAEGQQVIIIVDQFEELLTLTTDDKRRNAYADALVQCARSEDDSIRVVVLLRDDYLAQAETIPALRGVLSRGMQLLTIPSRRDLKRVVTEPARRVGYQFEPETLVDTMLDEVEGQTGALAMLSFAGERLWQHRDRHFHKLTTKSFRAIGGVAGALAQHAESFLGNLHSAQQKLLREAFRQLVTAEGTRTLVSRSDMRHALGNNDHADELIEQMIAERLIVSSDSDDSSEQLEVIHETLLTSWPRLVQWRREDNEGLRFRDQLRAASAQWDKRERPKGLLWRGDAQIECRLWQSRYSGKLTATEEAFVSASEHEFNRGRRFRRIALVTIALASFSAASVLWVMNKRAVAARNDAEVANKARGDQLRDNHERRAIEAINKGDAVRAVLHVDKAYELGAPTSAMEFVLARAKDSLSAQKAVLRGHTRKLYAATYSHDKKWIATGSSDRTAKLWDAKSGELIANFAGHQGDIYHVALSSDDNRLATVSDDGTAKIWNTRTKKLERTLDVGAASFRVAFTPDGKYVATAGLLGVNLWNLDDGSRSQLTKTMAANVAVHPAGTHLVAPRKNGTELVAWDLTSLQPRVISAGGNVSAAVYFSASGKYLAVTKEGTNQVQIWNTSDWSLAHTLTGHENYVTHAAFSADESRLVTTSRDTRAIVWSLAQGQEIARLRGHLAYVNMATFTDNDEYIVTVSSDSRIKVWTPKGEAVATLDGHTDIAWTVDVGPDGEICTAGWDGTARTWRVQPRGLRGSATGTRAVLAPNGDAATATGTSLVLRRDDKTLWTTELPAAVTNLVFDATGQRIAAQLVDKRFSIVDVQTGQVSSTIATPSSATPELIAVNAAGVLWKSGVDVYASNDSSHNKVHTAAKADSWFIASADNTQLIEQTLTKITLHELSANSQVTPIASLDIASSSGTALLPKSRLAIGVSSGEVVVWNYRTGDTQRFRGNGDIPVAITVSHSGQHMAAGTSGNTIMLWKLDTPDEVVQLLGHRGASTAVAFSADDKVLYTGSYDQTVRVWDLATSRSIFTYRGYSEPVVQVIPGKDRLHTATQSATAGDFRSWDISRDNSDAQAVKKYVGCSLKAEIDGGRTVRLDQAAGCNE